MKKITFIILTWNSEKYIENCLNSILNINNFDTEINVIDNGSKDKTVSLLKKFEKNTKKLKVIYIDKNIGTTKSRNLGLKNVDKSTDYVCVLDSDTIVNEKTFDVLIKELEKDSSIGIIAPTLKNSNNEVQLSGRKFPNVKIKLFKAFPSKKIQKIGEKMEEYNFVEGKNEVDYLISAFWLLKRKTIEDIGLFDEKIFYAPEDVEYCMRIYKSNLKCIFYNKVDIIHEYQRISKKKFFSKMNYEHIKGLIYYFKKYKYLFNPYKMK